MKVKHKENNSCLSNWATLHSRMVKESWEEQSSNSKQLQQKTQVFVNFTLTTEKLIMN